MLRSTLTRRWKAFFRDEEGATTVEYAVMIALIAVTCLVSAAQMSSATARSFDETAAAIAGAFN